MHSPQERQIHHQVNPPTSHSGGGPSVYLPASYPHQAFSAPPSLRGPYPPLPLYQSLPPPSHHHHHIPPFASHSPAYPFLRDDISMHHNIESSYPRSTPVHSYNSVAHTSAALPYHPHWHQVHPTPSAEAGAVQNTKAQLPIVASVSASSLTYVGHIKTSADAILLLAACDLPADASAAETLSSSTSTTLSSPPPRRIQRRLLETERAQLVKSGSVFVWDEEDAGMRRWTDGRCWSASRVSGCFLTYRELEARKRSANDVTGPRTNQYKIEGLIKQSFSMTTTSGRKMHIVSYYTKRDIREGRLRRVSEDPRFVGEAGGEWGLRIDEHEYPDPVMANSAQQDGDAVHDVTPSAKNDGDMDEAQTATTASSPIVQPSLAEAKYQPSSGSAPIAVPSDSPSRRSLGKRFADDSDGDPKDAVHRIMPAPPPLKRLRSSSTSDLLRLREEATHSSKMLTESNMRTAGLETAQRQEERQYEQKPLQHTRPRQQQPALDTKTIGKATHEAADQQDGRSAAGALLSLRSFFAPVSSPAEGFGGQVRPALGSASSGSGEGSWASSANSTSRGGRPLRRSYIDSGHESASTATPLTTPDYTSPGDKPFSPIHKKLSSASVHMSRRRSDGAVAAGERSDSDKDTLNRLNVRV